MAAVGWPLPEPSVFVTQAAIASPAGVIAIVGQSAFFDGSEIRVGEPNAAALRSAAWTVQRSSCVIQASAAEEPARRPWRCPAPRRSASARRRTPRRARA